MPGASEAVKRVKRALKAGALAKRGRPVHPAAVDMLDPGPRRKSGVQGYSKAMAERVLARLREGETLSQICAAPGMPERRSVLLWTERDPRFRAAYFRARVAAADALADQALAIADDLSRDRLANGDPDPVAVQRAKLRVDVRRWMASKLAPHRFGEKLTVEGDVQHQFAMISSAPRETREEWIEHRRQERLALPAPDPN